MNISIFDTKSVIAGTEPCEEFLVDGVADLRDVKSDLVVSIGAATVNRNLVALLCIIKAYRHSVLETILERAGFQLRFCSGRTSHVELIEMKLRALPPVACGVVQCNVDP